MTRNPDNHDALDLDREYSKLNRCNKFSITMLKSPYVFYYTKKIFRKLIIIVRNNLRLPNSDYLYKDK